MLTFIPHKINEDYNKVEYFRVNKELCDNELYKSYVLDFKTRKIIPNERNIQIIYSNSINLENNNLM
mgnify:CR=1 FL=1